jgi:hypothetical protein
MNFLSLDAFLDHFKSSKSKTFTDFMNKAMVKTANQVIPLKTYIQNKKVTKEDLKVLFENIQTRNEYLSRFYRLSLFIDKDRFHIFPLKPMKNKNMNNNESITYKNIIRNLHYKDILKNTSSDFENNPSYLDVIEDLYLHHIIDYKILTPSALFYTREGRLGSVFSSFYFRASIMNPYLVYSLNMSVLKGTRIFTPTLGWTSYLYGFLECPEVVEYVGVDVIPSVCKKTEKFAEKYYSNKKVDIYCEPSERLFHNTKFIKQYTDHFDTVFFSPPYYRLEIYKGGKQSTEEYKTYEEWLDKYWNTTMQLCHKVLKKGGKICYILSNYGSENSKEKYNLIEDMSSITKKYFKFISAQPMYNKDVHSTSHRETNEQILIFTK